MLLVYIPPKISLCYKFLCSYWLFFDIVPVCALAKLAKLKLIPPPPKWNSWLSVPVCCDSVTLSVTDNKCRSAVLCNWVICIASQLLNRGHITKQFSVSPASAANDKVFSLCQNEFVDGWPQWCTVRHVWRRDMWLGLHYIT